MPIQSNTGGGGSITETDPIYTADKPAIALKSELPTSTSDLTNVSGFITDSDLPDISGLATKVELQKAINLATAMAVAL